LVFFTMLSKESGRLCPPNPLGFFALGLLRQGPALGRWAARRRPHLPFARLHRRSSCVPAELYPTLQHRHLGRYRFHCQLLAQTVFHTGTVSRYPNVLCSSLVTVVNLDVFEDLTPALHPSANVCTMQNVESHRRLTTENIIECH